MTASPTDRHALTGIARQLAMFCFCGLSLSPLAAQVLPPDAASTPLRYELELVEGVSEATVPASTLAWTAEGLRLGSERIALDDVVSLRFPGESRVPGAFLAILAGGDRLWCDAVASAGDEALSLRSAALHTDASSPAIRVPLPAVREICVRSAFASPSELARFLSRHSPTGGDEAASSRSTENDVVFLRTGTEVPGVLVSIGDSGIRFETDDAGAIELAFEKIRALELALLESEPKRDADAPPGRLVSIELRDGSRLTGRVAGLDGRVLRFVHAALGERAIDLALLAELRVLDGRASYLSDLDPVEAEESLGPLVRRKMPHRRDRSVVDTPLLIRGRSFAKGLGAHAYSRLVFEIPAGARRFQARVGLDDSARPRGGDEGVPQGIVPSVVFRVSLDGKRVFEEIARFGDEARAVDLSVEGGKRLSLEIDFARPDRLPHLDRADWAEARFVR